MKNILFFSFLFFSFASTFAQSPFHKDNTRLREGNEQYKKKEFVRAERLYREALEINAKNTKAAFNLGNALYEQKRYEEAARQFAENNLIPQDANMKAQAFHNQGNALLAQKKYEAAAEAFKNSLRLNPNSADTRYNLAYTQKFLKQQEQEQKEKDKDNKEEQKNKDEQQQEEKQQQEQQEQQNQQEKQQQEEQEEQQKREQEEQQKKEQQEKEGQQPEKEGQPQQPQNQQPEDKQNAQKGQANLRKEEAERILNALQSEEAKARAKIYKRMTQDMPQQNGNWQDW